MGKREDLQLELQNILGTGNVYFQPPESIKLKYPAIIYNLSNIDGRHANNKLYMKKRSYQIILIDEDPDSEFVDQILDMPYCRFDRSYPSDGLNHFVFSLYY